MALGLVAVGAHSPCQSATASSPVELIAGAVRGRTVVAVAANFAEPMGLLAARFEAETGHRLTVVVGSTGKHYAQIVHGAPFDLVFAADAERPQRLEAAGLAIAGTRFTYALGRLALWSPTPGLVDGEGRVLETGDFRHLAIANPRLAPYGRAALETLERRGLATGLAGRLVQGENVAQAFQMIASGNAELGFVAVSQILESGTGTKPSVRAGSHWPVPDTLYSPIEQQAVLVRDGAVAREFLAFVASEPARAVIREHGYATP